VSAARAGRRVLITKRWPELVSGLAAAGIIAAEVPTIEVKPPVDPEPIDRALRRLGDYDWLVFTSANAVEAVLTRMTELGLTMPEMVSAASVGPVTTAAVLAAWPRLRVAVQPDIEFRGTALVHAFAGQDLVGRRILLPVSDRAPETVERGLAARGAVVDRVVAYQTGAAPGTRERLLVELGLDPDAVAFASPSAVEAFIAAVGARARRIGAVAIGPTTAEAARTAGLTVIATAEPSTVAGMVEAIQRALDGVPGDG
jgi:uroporphyrinogen-III synthase